MRALLSVGLLALVLSPAAGAVTPVVAAAGPVAFHPSAGELCRKAFDPEDVFLFAGKIDLTDGSAVVWVNARQLSGLGSPSGSSGCIDQNTFPAGSCAQDAAGNISCLRYDTLTQTWWTGNKMHTKSTTYLGAWLTLGADGALAYCPCGSAAPMFSGTVART